MFVAWSARYRNKHLTTATCRICINNKSDYTLYASYACRMAHGHYSGSVRSISIPNNDRWVLGNTIVRAFRNFKTSLAALSTILRHHGSAK